MVLLDTKEQRYVGGYVQLPDFLPHDGGPQMHTVSRSIAQIGSIASTGKRIFSLILTWHLHRRQLRHPREYPRPLL